MSAERLVWIVDAEPVDVVAGLAPDRSIVLDVTDDGVWDLAPSRLVWAVTVRSPSECVEVLEAVLRGIAVVVRVRPELGATVAARFVDDLHRASATDVGEGPPAPLADDQRRLLTALAGGATLRAAAGDLGVSARTATRLLAGARRTLGCQTTAEAVRRLADTPGS